MNDLTEMRTRLAHAYDVDLRRFALQRASELVGITGGSPVSASHDVLAIAQEYYDWLRAVDAPGNERTAA